MTKAKSKAKEDTKLNKWLPYALLAAVALFGFIMVSGGSDKGGTQPTKPICDENTETYDVKMNQCVEIEQAVPFN